MENIKEKLLKFLHLENLIENLSGYIRTQVDLFKLELREEVSKIVSHGLMVVVLFLLFALFLVFFSFGLAALINEKMGSAFWGFWIVSGIYGLPFLIFLMFRKSISQYFERHIMSQFNRKDK